MKYTLVSLEFKRKGIVGYYKADPNNPQEKPFRMVGCPERECLRLLLEGNPSLLRQVSMIQQTIDAEVVEYKLDGVYEYPNGRQTDTITTFCPKAENGLYVRGHSPQEQIARKLNVLKKVSE